MIRQFSVEEIYATAGFANMVIEYSKMADPSLPPPTYKKEDYLAIEKDGRLGIFCAIDNGNIVGFVSVVKGFLPKFSILVAITESIFVLEEYRKKGYGIRLIEATEDYARMNGIRNVFINIPDSALDTLGMLLKRRRYSAKTHSYGRVL